MLEPQERRLFLESLRPPAGYHLDQAIGTTLSATVDPVEERLDALLEQGRRSLGRRGLEARISPVEDTDLYEMTLCLPDRRPELLPAGVSASCWPSRFRAMASGRN